MPTREGMRRARDSALFWGDAQRHTPMQLQTTIMRATYLLDIRDAVRTLLGDRWPQRSAEWQQVIRGAMAAHQLSALDAALRLIREQPAGEDATAQILAAFCDLSEAEGATADAP